MSYDHTKYLKYKSLGLRHDVALALADDSAPVNIVITELPTIPESGTYTLTATDGVLSWEVKV